MTINAEHPFWKTFHWVAIVAIVGVVLKWNASNFDSTELKSIAQIAIGVGGMMGAQSFFTKKGGE